LGWHWGAQSIVGPILQQYTESTDGANVEAKESAFVWHYGAADPDFGSLQARLLPRPPACLVLTSAPLP
jgi:trehalose-6-phosphatase